MLRFLIRRLLLMVLVLVGVSLITYGLTYLMPGDPARRLAGPGASVQTVQSIRHQLGLDLPFWAQYGRYMGRLLHGDLGHSYVQ
ncbi:MAG: glutathione ABC transporter permease GsiC, partial [Chloroflexi bacterium]|nr:glutathione ABC transporter permease GsiC [Chloroflexota bacterium]